MLLELVAAVAVVVEVLVFDAVVVGGVVLLVVGLGALANATVVFIEGVLATLVVDVG